MGTRYVCQRRGVCGRKRVLSLASLSRVMAYDPDLHNRRSIRLDDYDYRNAGAYFVTICTDDKRLLFGEVVRGRMRLSPCGRVAVDEWHRTEQLRDNVALDAFVVMPNHVHGIVVITKNASNNERRGTMHRAPTTDGASKNDKNTTRREFGRPQAGSLAHRRHVQSRRHPPLPPRPSP